jgi:hypothetical protein
VQHLGSNQDRCLDQYRQVERVAGPRIDRLHPRRAVHLHGGDIGLLHQLINSDLADPSAQRVYQGSDELVGHRTGPGDPTQASGQAEGLWLADLDGKVPVACHLLQHDVVEQLVVSCKPDDLGDPHLDIADRCRWGHGGLPPRPLWPIFRSEPAEGEGLGVRGPEAIQKPPSRCKAGSLDRDGGAGVVGRGRQPPPGPPSGRRRRGQECYEPVGVRRTGVADGS